MARSGLRIVAVLGVCAAGFLPSVARAAADSPGAIQPISAVQSHSTPPARARSGWNDPWSAPWELDGMLSLGSPVGVLGMELEYAPARWLTLDVGAGSSAQLQARGAAALGVRLPMGSLAIGLAAGASVGNLRNNLDFSILGEGLSKFAIAEARPGVWSDDYLTLEYRWKNLTTYARYPGVYGSTKIIAGAETLLNPGSLHCFYEDTDGHFAGNRSCHDSDGAGPFTGVTPFVGIAIGGAW